MAPVLEQDSDGSDDEHGAPIIMQQLYGPNAPGNNYPLFLSLVAQICHAFPAPLESKLPSPVPSADTYIGNRCLVPYHLMRLRANGSQPRLINSAKALRQAAALGQVRTSALRFLARASLRPTLVSKEVKPVSELSPAELKLALSLQGVKPLGNTKATKVARLKLAVSDAPIIRHHLNQLLYREGALQLQKRVHSFVFPPKGSSISETLLFSVFESVQLEWINDELPASQPWSPAIPVSSLTAFAAQALFDAERKRLGNQSTVAPNASGLLPSMDQAHAFQNFFTHLTFNRPKAASASAAAATEEEQKRANAEEELFVVHFKTAFQDHPRRGRSQ